MTTQAIRVTGHDFLALRKQVNDLTYQLRRVEAELGYQSWSDLTTFQTGIDQRPFRYSETEWLHLQQDATLAECSICGGLCRLGSYIEPDAGRDRDADDWELRKGRLHTYAVCTVCDHAEAM